jgi:hypothetical protein
MQAIENVDVHSFYDAFYVIDFAEGTVVKDQTHDQEVLVDWDHAGFVPCIPGSLEFLRAEDQASA